MALKMTQREVDGVSVVALDGRIVLGEESNALREKVKSLIAGGKKKIVLNMDNVTFIDSAGLGTLVAAHHHRTNVPHGKIHAELRRLCGGPPSAQATIEQLEERIATIQTL